MQNVSRRSPFLRALGPTARVLFSTLLFAAGGMGLGLLLGIIGLVTYGLIAGIQPDMRNAYRHVAIPVAITIGCAAFDGALVLEFRNREQ